MKEISLKDIIKFSRKSQKSRATLIRNTQQPKTNIAGGGGGNYWIRSLSAISKACKLDNNLIITEKIEDILLAQKHNTSERTLNMYLRNIRILEAYENYSFDILKPNSEINYLKGIRSNSIINTGGLPIQIIPSLVYEFQEEDELKIGSILFIAQLDGYRTSEHEVLCEALYRYLKINYMDNFTIERDFCIVVDVIKKVSISHSQIDKKRASRKLNKIIKEIIKLF